MAHIATEEEDTMSVEMVSFTAHDRCDSCGSQALALARKNDSELMFCAHHNDRHEDKLLEDGWEIAFDQATYDSYSANQYQSAVH